MCIHQFGHAYPSSLGGVLDFTSVGTKATPEKRGHKLKHISCKYSNTSQKTTITIGLDKLTNTFADADETTGRRRIYRTQGWRFAADAILPGHRRAHLRVPARTPTIHHASCDTTNTTRPRLLCLALVTNISNAILASTRKKA